MSGRRVVVIGATGNVGTSVVEALAERDDVSEVIGLARRPTAWTVAKASFHAVDLTTDALEPWLSDVDAVVHAGWVIQPSHRPLETWSTNVLGTERLLDAIAAACVPTLVYLSSIGAYSRRAPELSARVDESWPTHSLPIANYGREKAYVERLLDVHEARHPGTRVVRLRSAFIFKRAAGTEQRRLFAGRLVPGRLLEPGRLPCLPYPNGLRLQAVHTSDVAEAIVRAIVGDAQGPFNLAAEPVLDGDDLAAALGTRLVLVPRWLARLGLRLAWHARLVPTQPALLDLALELPVMDTARARTVLGWTPHHSAREALTELVGGVADGATGPTPPLS